MRTWWIYGYAKDRQRPCISWEMGSIRGAGESGEGDSCQAVCIGDAASRVRRLVAALDLDGVVAILHGDTAPGDIRNRSDAVRGAALVKLNTDCLGRVDHGGRSKECVGDLSQNVSRRKF